MANLTLSDVVTQLANDQLGNVVFEKQGDPAGRGYVFDQLGRMTRAEVDVALGAEFDYTYDAAGNVTKQTETRKTPAPTGPVISAIETNYAYDESGRPRSVDEHVA